nr:synaptobrevin, longin-like domain protein [Tanacetum cinerariifolium]
VNTPRCDEDRLELMELTVFLLPKVEKVRVETTVAVKKVNDVTRFQALVDKKKVVVMEATIRDALRLDDAEGVGCLPNEKIFAELARMGYKKPSTKLTFYKAFFSSQWKFLIHTILQCISAKRTSWNEFSSSMASAVIYLSSGRKFNFSKYIFDSLVRNVDSPTKFHTVGKGFSGVETPLFEGMIVEQQVAEGADEVHDKGVPAAGGIIENINADEDVILEDAKDVAADVEDGQDADIQVNADIQRMTADEVVTAASTTITVADVPIPAVTTAAAPTLTAAPSRRTKGVVIRDPEETTTTSTIIHVTPPKIRVTAEYCTGGHYFIILQHLMHENDL